MRHPHRVIPEKVLLQDIERSHALLQVAQRDANAAERKLEHEQRRAAEWREHERRISAKIQRLQLEKEKLVWYCGKFDDGMEVGERQRNELRGLNGAVERLEEEMRKRKIQMREQESLKDIEKQKEQEQQEQKMRDEKSEAFYYQEGKEACGTFV